MALQLENVAHHSGAVETIRNVSLTLEAGAINVLLGPTLSGKTTLMRLMAGLETPASGRIVMNGADVTGRPVTKRSVAMVYQQFINYPSFTVYENIASPLRKQKITKSDIDAKVRDVAALLKLEPYLDKTPLQLSGGQQQRTAIARAIVKNAELVLLDEPLANLDYKLREELRIELPRIFDASGAIFVYATTEPSEALLLGGRTATLHEGRVTQFGPTPLVYRRPRDRVTAQTFSDPPMNFARIAVASGRAAFATAQTTTFVCPPSFANLPDGLYTIGFRAHHATLASHDASRFAVTGIVTVAELSGSDTFLHLDLPGGERWIALLTGVHDFAPGVAVTLSLDPARFFAFDTSGDLVAAPAGA